MRASRLCFSVFLLLVLGVASGCDVLDGPCAEGYWRPRAMEACVPVPVGEDAGTVDASTVDAGDLDASTMDASTSDGGSMDADVSDGATLDADVSDGSALDANVDADIPDGAGPDA